VKCKGDLGKEEKPSAVKKSVKKMHKFLGSKFMKALLKKMKSKAVADAAPSAAPSASASASAEVPPLEDIVAGPFALGEKVRIWSDMHGKACCGVAGAVLKYVGPDKVLVETDKLTKHEVLVTSVEKVEGLKGMQVQKSLKQVTGALRQEWLVKCGWSDEERIGEDSFTALKAELAGSVPVLVRAEHLQFYWLWLQWSLSLPSTCRFVDPLLLHYWMDFGLEESAVNDNRLKALKTEFIADAVVCLPVNASDHWTLAVVNMQQKEVRYYDSLAVESEACFLRADAVLTKLKHHLESLAWIPAVMPHRVNSVKQGPLECGFFVMWWVEAECRSRLGEGRNRRGWPTAAAVRNDMLKFFVNLEPAAKRMQALLADAAKAEEAKAKSSSSAAATAAASSGAAEEELKKLAGIAAEGMTAGEKGEFHLVCVDVETTPEAWAADIMEFLLPAHRAEVEKVRSFGAGVCSSCRWTSGCHRCLWWKAVRYWRNKETGGKFMEAYSDTAKAKVKAKAKSVKGGGSLDVSA
jgi:hypothetical protein